MPRKLAVITDAMASHETPPWEVTVSIGKETRGIEARLCAELRDIRDDRVTRSIASLVGDGGDNREESTGGRRLVRRSDRAPHSSSLPMASERRKCRRRTSVAFSA